MFSFAQTPYPFSYFPSVNDRQKRKQIPAEQEIKKQGASHRSHIHIYLNVISLPGCPLKQLTRMMSTQANASCHPCMFIISDWETVFNFNYAPIFSGFLFNKMIQQHRLLCPFQKLRLVSCCHFRYLFKHLYLAFLRFILRVIISIVQIPKRSL